MGNPGSLPGEFNLPHNVCCDKDGWIYVADRETPEFKFLILMENSKNKSIICTDPVV